jgi:hypothetical protein
MRPAECRRSCRTQVVILPRVAGLELLGGLADVMLPECLSGELGQFQRAT